MTEAGAWDSPTVRVAARVVVTGGLETALVVVSVAVFAVGTRQLVVDPKSQREEEQDSTGS